MGSFACDAIQVGSSGIGIAGGPQRPGGLIISIKKHNVGPFGDCGLIENRGNKRYNQPPRGSGHFCKLRLRVKSLEYVIALIALSAMEIVLGIDNVVFMAILSGRLPAEQQPTARRIGLALALIMRLLLLLSLSYIMRLTEP